MNAIHKHKMKIARYQISYENFRNNVFDETTSYKTFDETAKVQSFYLESALLVLN